MNRFNILTWNNTCTSSAVKYYTGCDRGTVFKSSRWLSDNTALWRRFTHGSKWFPVHKVQTPRLHHMASCRHLSQSTVQMSPDDFLSASFHKAKTPDIVSTATLHCVSQSPDGFLFTKTGWPCLHGWSYIPDVQ
jgi:hypothetical protein